MFNIQKYLRRVVLALGLTAVSLTASATLLPTYKIAATDTVAADIGSFDVLFSSINSPVAVTASLTHFTGTPLEELDRSFGISGIMGNYSIVNTGVANDLYLGVNGPFAFDLNFSESFLSSSNASENNNGFFSIVLYDSTGALIGDQFGALQFALSNTGVTVTSTTSALSLTAVPEPADWALMLTGLGLIVYMTRRSGRANARRLAAA